MEANAGPFREAFHELPEDEAFNAAITYGPNDPSKVHHRFEAASNMMKEILGAPTD